MYVIIRDVESYDDSYGVSPNNAYTDYSILGYTETLEEARQFVNKTAQATKRLPSGVKVFRNNTGFQWATNREYSCTISGSKYDKNTSNEDEITTTYIIKRLKKIMI